MPDWNHDFRSFIEHLYRYGLEFFRRYHGPYRALVVNNQDPEGLGRIIVECPRARLSSDNAVWALPMMNGAGDKYGFFWPPEEGDYVWVFFENGDPESPLCYMGGWYASDEVDDTVAPEDDGVPKKRGFRTKGGHAIILDDNDGAEKITIRHKDGTVVQWTDDNKVRVGNEDGSFEPLVKGSALKQYIDSHTHPHSWGPTGPPTSPLPNSALSNDTETS